MFESSYESKWSFDKTEAPAPHGFTNHMHIVQNEDASYSLKTGAHAKGYKNKNEKTTANIARKSV